MKSIFTFLLGSTLVLFSQKSIAQNDATSISITGSTTTNTITKGVPTVVDNALVVTADGNITNFVVTITGSYQSGDALAATGTQSGITISSFNTTTKSLVFTGVATAAQWQALLRTVTLSAANVNCYPEQRAVNFSAGAAAPSGSSSGTKYFNPLNGHYYETVSGSIKWADALLAASKRSYYGRVGYLATMTSLAENNFIWKIMSTDSWMGASDNNAYINAATGTTTYANNTGAGSSDGRWYWVTGPEKGTLFSVGNNSPVTQSGQFAYWNPGEPNGSNGSEDCGQFYSGSGGHWNDLGFNRTLNAYIVEYGGMTEDNTSQTIGFTRNFSVAGSVSGTVSGGGVSVCTGTNTTTLTYNGTGTVVRWESSIDDFIATTNTVPGTSTTNTIANLATTTYYRAVVNASACSALATSSTPIYVTGVVAGNIVSPSSTICAGGTVNLILNGNSGTVNKWQVSDVSTFASGIVDINQTTTSITTTLGNAGTYYFRAEVQIAGCGAAVTTSAYPIKVNSGTPPVGGTVSSLSSCTSNASGTLNLTGYTGTISKWQSSINNGTNWTDISNTNTYYNYSGINSNTLFRAQVINGACGTAYSNNGTITIYGTLVNPNPVPSVSIVADATYICTAPITFTATPTNGGSSPAFEWKKNGTSVGTGTTYTDNGLAGSDVITCTLTSNAACATVTSATSNNLSIPGLSTVTNASICSGNTYMFNGNPYTATGTYTDRFTSVDGCDSNAILKLTVNPLSTSTTNLSICPSALPYNWNGLTFTSAGTQTAHLLNSNNCDSVATLNLTLKAVSNSTTNISICQSALPYTWNGLTFTAAGSKTYHTTNSVGCDSAATLYLMVNSPSASITVIKVPFGSTYLFNGVTYSATGIYTAILRNQFGCDSTATLDFSVDPKPSAGPDQTVACGSTVKTVTLTGTLPTTGVWSSMAGNDPTATIGTNTNGVVEITLPVAPFTGKLSYVYTTFGGKDTVDIYLAGPTSPMIKVNAGSPIICAGSTVQLCPLTWGFSNYQWYKDGYAVAGATGTGSCITVDASGVGSYTLAGTNGSGCWSVPSAPQVVSTTNSLTKPTISRSGATTLCNGGSVTLTSSSATGNLWFKNGNSTGAITTSITVTEPGDYSVLVSTGTCTSAMSVITTVAGGVKASFTTANATNNCDSTFSFTSTSANTTSRWNFGDGTTGTGNSVTHKYATVALFTVQQAVISTGGCKDTAVQTVTIVSCPPPPAPTTCNITPGFTIINNTVNGGSYTYISNSTITNGNMTYFWDLGNGTTSTLISPSVTYATAGTYQVKLVVTGNLGCKDSITQSVVVTIAAPPLPPVTPPACTAPVADFTIANATQCLVNNAFSFSNTSIGTAPSYSWIFGDGSAAVTTTAAAHTYATANTYTVTLVATNSCGSNQVSKTVTVITVPATPASISGSTSITAGATTTLSSATAGGVWSSNNTAVVTVNTSGVVTGVAAGTANISYTVTNSCGATTTSLSITVTAVIPPVCTAPVANFTIANATQCLVNNSFSFSNSSTGTTPSYTWTFGDGSASVTTTASAHSYAAANTYTVTLVATNSCGSNQVSKTVTIQSFPQVPSGISGATTLTAGSTRNYSSATAGGAWSSNNTAVATIDVNTGVVTGVTAGTATISYTVSNSCGATATSLSITVTAVVPPVTPPACNVPVADFTIANATQCLVNNAFSFTNTSTGTAPSYIWTFGDGSASVTTTAAAHSYAAANAYTVTLVATNSCGSNQVSKTVVVGAKPTASFSILTHTGSGQSTTFISSSTIAAGSMSYLWDLGNGQTSTLVNPTTSYTPGTYTIQLIVSGIGTCKDSSIQSITELAISSVKVYPNPVIDAIQVSFVSASATPTTFKLMDLAGRTLQVQTVTPSSRGVNVLASLNTKGLQSGSYLLYISDELNGFLATKAILKQ